jgi:DNA repair protein RadC
MEPLLQSPIPYRLPRHRRLPLRDQPLYRVANDRSTCTLIELLAVLIGGPRQIDTAEALLERFGGSLSGLAQAHITEIGSVSGVGQQSAARLQATIELGRRIALELASQGEERPAVHSPSDAAALVQYEMSLLEQEELRTVLLDTRNRAIQTLTVYRGSLNASQVRVGEVFKEAIRRNAAAVIVIHNHPSGDPSPSPDDVAVTRAIVQAGKLLDVEVLDHLVIGRGKFTSLKERGLGFS